MDLSAVQSLVLLPGLCVSYSVRLEGGDQERRYARQLVPRGASWSFQPLFPAETVDLALCPVHPHQAALALVDGVIRPIPALVLDTRLEKLGLLEEPALSTARPLMVVHEHWFRSYHAVFRDGMADIFRISIEFNGPPRGDGEPGSR
jgi:hypothetical protein